METELLEREPYLAQLDAQLEQAVHGAGRTVLVSGEAGIGKTTVVDLFVASLPTPYEVGIGRGQCVETYGEGEPYLPMLEALGQLG